MKILKSLILSLFLISSSLLSSAQMELPAPSPSAKVIHTVGLTEVEIEYSSPGVKGREIFGELVPYGKLWRTGANKATKITFSKDVKIMGEEVKAGSYALFTIPGKENWTIILNSETEQWGTGRYDENNDVARFEVEAEEVEMRERMVFIISNATYDGAGIDLEWDETRVSLPFEVATDEQAMASISRELGSVSGKYASAARYTLRAGDHYDKGMEWINKSIELNQSWYNTWLKARLLHETEEHKDAKKWAEKAMELGEEAENFFYKDDVQAALDNWPKK